MALTNQEKTAIRAIMQREGEAFFDEARDLSIGDKRAAALTLLNSVVTVTVTDWQIPATFMQQADSATLISVIQDAKAMWAAHDSSKLGAIFIQLLGAAAKHLGQ